jgi:choline kinase
MAGVPRSRGGAPGGAIRTGVLLAAGHGSRLRLSAPYKPLCPVAGRPLIDHALTGMAEAGLERAVVVLGYGAGAVAEHLARTRWPLFVEAVFTPDPDQPNGVSVLAAAPALAGEPAVLAMCDHLVTPALYARLAAAGAGDGATLGIDRRVGHPWVDPDDVTWVKTEGDAIVDIGKGLAGADCYDTGVFAIGPGLFSALGTFRAPSLTDGMRLLAGERRARVVDCSDLDWIDVDDPAALAKAEAWQLARAA